MLGSGATAVSAILAARRLGARHVEVVARNVRAMGELIGRFGDSSEPGSSTQLHLSGTPLHHLDPVVSADPAIGNATLVISTLPGPIAQQLALPDRLTGIPLFDVAYDPWPSPLAERWRGAGGEAHSGIGMLVEQALIQIRIFRGGDPDVVLPDEPGVLAAMRDASQPVGR